MIKYLLSASTLALFATNALAVWDMSLDDYMAEMDVSVAICHKIYPRFDKIWSRKLAKTLAEAKGHGENYGKSFAKGRAMPDYARLYQERMKEKLALSLDDQLQCANRFSLL